MNVLEVDIKINDPQWDGECFIEGVVVNSSLNEPENAVILSISAFDKAETDFGV